MCGPPPLRTDDGDAAIIGRLVDACPLLAWEMPTLRSRARALVCEHRVAIERLASALRERRSLNGREIERLLA
jgi:hypothetical protein